jgi:hypothetical protein
LVLKDLGAGFDAPKLRRVGVTGELRHLLDAESAPDHGQSGAVPECVLVAMLRDVYMAILV